MIQKSDVSSIKKWFELYVCQFCTENESFNEAICLKVKHTKRVASEIIELTRSLNISDTQSYMAEIIAMLHDIGRFEQYARYQTYSDDKSEDHARLGVDIIKRTGIISKFTLTEQNIITDAILHHNRISLPESNDNEFLLMLKLIRDADKIDILQLLTDHYSGIKTNNVVDIGLGSISEVTDAVVECVINNRPVKFHDLKTLNDFKLLQISWVYDLNFAKTCEIFINRQFIEKISDTLPKIEKVSRAVNVAKQHLLSMFENERKCINVW